jgi:hypothetical protein
VVFAALVVWLSWLPERPWLAWLPLPPWLSWLPPPPWLAWFYQYCRRIAQTIKDMTDADGFVYSYYTNVAGDTGGKTINFALFGRPISEGKLGVVSINTIRLNRTEAARNCGSSGRKAPCEDAIFLSVAESVPLVSDDLRYRQIGNMNGVAGLWLQIVLMAAASAGAMDQKKAVAAYVQLAARRHGHVHVSAAVLLDAFEICTDDRLLELDALTNYIGGTNPEMSSHTVVAAQFIWPLWHKGEPELKAQKATSMIIEKLLQTSARHGIGGIV